MTGNFYSKNGTLGPVEAAHVPLDDINFEYGYGVYETLKLRSGVLHFADLHVERLLHSAACIGLGHGFKKENIVAWLNELVSRNCILDSNVKMLLVGSDSMEQPANLFIMQLNPLFPKRQDYRLGASALIFAGERWIPQAKSLNMLMSSMAYRDARAVQAYDAILMDKAGFLREGTRTNLFYTDGEQFFTPPEESVLAGVTRHTILECVKENGLVCTERALHTSEIENTTAIKGLFLTSTSTKIMPVSKIVGMGTKDIVFEIPENVRVLMKAYDIWLDAWRSAQTPVVI